jgi:hypothetical protein
MIQPRLESGGSGTLAYGSRRRPLGRTMLLAVWGLLLTAVFVARQMSPQDLNAVYAFLRSLPPIESATHTR